MSHLSKTVLICMTGATVAWLSEPSALAFPGSAKSDNSCSVCHGPSPGTGRKVPGLMSVSGFSIQTDLGTQLDAKVRGPLKTFQALSGTTVQLSVDVLAAADLGSNPKYALQIKRLEKSGQQVSLQNFLAWTEANPNDNPWVMHDDPNIPAGVFNPYYTKSLATGETGTFTFNLSLGSETPMDIYDIEFAIAGKDSKGMFYQDEHFYLAVLAPELLTDQAVTWSTAMSDAGYVLEVADNAQGPWQTYTGPSAILDGSNVVLMKTADGSRKFFRLIKP